jgi:integrase
MKLSMALIVIGTQPHVAIGSIPARLATRRPPRPRAWVILLAKGRRQARKGIAMTALRQRMIEDLRLRGFSERTQEAYVRAVQQLAKHYHKSPDLITEDEIRSYFLYLAEVKKFARSSTTIALCGIKFFYERTLGLDWKVFGLVRPRREHKLPVVLGREEVRRILACVRIDLYRACLRLGPPTTISVLPSCLRA